MESRSAFNRLERAVRRLAMATGVATALAVSGGFGLVSYFDQVKMQQFQARLAAERVAQYAYVQGPTWRFSSHRIPELIAFVTVDMEARQVVADAQGNAVASIGDAPPPPTLRVSAPIVSGADVIGTVTIESSLLAFLYRLASIGALGVALGFSVYGTVNYFPLRVLRRTMASLIAAQNELRTQIRQTEAALEISQHERQRAEIASRTKSEFLANMSHELRTPLNAIIGFSDLTRSQTFGAVGERYRSYAEDIHASGSHLLRIINDILDIAKVEAGHFALSTESVGTLDIAVECARICEERAREAGIDLRVGEGSNAAPSLIADPVRLKQILLNLLSNAIKFTPRGGTVTVSVRGPEDGRIEFEVADTGIGMSTEEVRLAVQPFRQVDNTHTRRYQGTGLGLSIAKALTELHGGHLRVTSEPGRGTTVTICLPVNASSDASREPSIVAARSEAA